MKFPIAPNKKAQELLLHYLGEVLVNPRLNNK